MHVLNNAELPAPESQDSLVPATNICEHCYYPCSGKHFFYLFFFLSKSSLSRTLLKSFLERELPDYSQNKASSSSFPSTCVNIKRREWKAHWTYFKIPFFFFLLLIIKGIQCWCLLKYLGPNGVLLALHLQLTADFVPAVPSWGCPVCGHSPCTSCCTHPSLCTKFKKKPNNLSDSIYKTVTQPDTW